MCFLPPNCIFCAHYNNNHHSQTESSRDCRAFKEIPKDILFGGNEHTQSYPGDSGLLFLLKPKYAEEYAEVRELRISLREGLFKTQKNDNYCL